MLGIAAVRILANPTPFAHYNQGFPGIVGSYSGATPPMGVIPRTAAAIVLRAKGSRADAISALIRTVISIVTLVTSKRAGRFGLCLSPWQLRDPCVAGVWICAAMTEVLTTSVITMAYLDLIMVTVNAPNSLRPHIDR